MDCNKAKTLIKEICFLSIKARDIAQGAEDPQKQIPNVYDKDSNCYKAVDWYNRTCSSISNNSSNMSTK